LRRRKRVIQVEVGTGIATIYYATRETEYLLDQNTKRFIRNFDNKSSQDRRQMEPIVIALRKIK
jgi:hypothetical protein